MDNVPPNTRLLFVLLAAASSFMIFMTSERCFGQADVRNAVHLAQSLKTGPGKPTIPQALAAEHPSVAMGQIGWGGTITDNFYGIVRVRAAVPGPGETINYLFDVNLTGQRVHPANDRSRALMESLRVEVPPSDEVEGALD